MHPDSVRVFRYQLEVVLGTLGSIVFSVLIIFVNKHLVQNEGFTSMATLTGWHVAFTCLVISGSAAAGLLEHKVLLFYLSNWPPLTCNNF